jgi:hypothetical protein
VPHVGTVALDEAAEAPNGENALPEGRNDPLSISKVVMYEFWKVPSSPSDERMGGVMVSVHDAAKMAAAMAIRVRRFIDASWARYASTRTE